MFTKRATSIALAVVTGLAPVVMATAPVFASTTQPANPAASTVQPGTSASTATAPVSGWVQIAPHSSQWFKFKYNYDDSLKKENRDNTPQQAMVELTMQQPGSMGFDVWTPGRLQNPQYTHTDIHHRNGEITPVGVGTPMFEDVTHHKNANGIRESVTETNPSVLVWSGSQGASDTFYVEVMNNTDSPASYMLSVSGPAVSY